LDSRINRAFQKQGNYDISEERNLDSIYQKPAIHEAESPANTIRLMEEVCERENLLEALRRVKGNKGSAGIDGYAWESPTCPQRGEPEGGLRCVFGIIEPCSQLIWTAMTSTGKHFYKNISLY